MNPRHLVIAIIAILAGLALACWLSPWIDLAIFAVCLGAWIWAGIQNSPIDPPWAEESPWFNCDCCDRSWAADGRIETFTPRICAPMDTCPKCLEVKRKAMEGVTNFVKLEIAKRN